MVSLGAESLVKIGKEERLMTRGGITIGTTTVIAELDKSLFCSFIDLSWKRVRFQYHKCVT